MNVKNVVKVMNFHALIRVDSSKKRAEKYAAMEHELMHMLSMLFNNRNFVMDKKVMNIPENMPSLNIYIGSDYGFCNNYNSTVNDCMASDNDNADRILIGKKLRLSDEKNVLMRVSREELSKDFSLLEKILVESIRKRKYASINVFYNEYENITSIHFVKKQIFPFEIPVEENESIRDDFLVEGDAEQLLLDLLLTYCGFELKIILMNTAAAENLKREDMTRDSLRKIDEREELQRMEDRRELKKEQFHKVVENFQKMSYR